MLEFVLLFFAGPTLFAYARHRIHVIPALWILTAGCLFALLRDPRFDRVRLWNAAAFPHYAGAIVLLFIGVAVIGSAMVLHFAPPGFFLRFPRSKPRRWAAVILLYPMFSVYPQGIVYRAFLFERYQDLFAPRWAMVLASAAAFAWVHIVFRNRLAVALSFFAGILFALRYLQTGSLFVSAFEHTLYGCGIFTIGLGDSFYQRAVRK